MTDVSVNIPEEVLKQYARLLEKQKQHIPSDRARKDFMSYCKTVWPEFIEGKHHKIMAKKFNGLADGSIKRLIVNMPPRHTKSEFASYLLPSYLMQFAVLIIFLLILIETYGDIYPSVTLSKKL